MDLSKESRYFIALVPPKEICVEVFNYKQVVAKNFKSKGALRSEAHITLHMPFMWPNKRLNELKSVISQVATSAKSFEIQTSSFGFFEPRVVYIDVIKSEPLQEIQSTLNLQMRNQLHLTNSNYKDKVFNPHITIGFRDLKKQIFLSVKEYFAPLEYVRKWEQTNISLLLWKEEQWHPLESFELKGE